MCFDNVKKLLIKIESIIVILNRERSYRVHQQVDQFFYMQKSAELSLLIQHYEELQEQIDQIDEWVEEKYVEVFNRWKKDARWLGKNLY